MAAAITRMPPPMLPSQDFPGEMRGKSLCLPNKEPQMYAPASLIHRNTNTHRGSIGSNVTNPCGEKWKARMLINEKGRAM